MIFCNHLQGMVDQSIHNSQKKKIKKVLQVRIDITDRFIELMIGKINQMMHVKSMLELQTVFDTALSIERCFDNNRKKTDKAICSLLCEHYELPIYSITPGIMNDFFSNDDDYLEKFNSEHQAIIDLYSLEAAVYVNTWNRLQPHHSQRTTGQI